MSTSVWSRAKDNKLWAGMIVGAMLLILAAISMPTYNLSLRNADLLRQGQASRADYDSVLQAKQQVALSASLESPAPPPAPTSEALNFERKMVRTSSLEMTVASPLEAAEKIRALTANLGGYIESSEVNAQDSPSATMTIRVPAAKLDAAKAQLRGLAVRIDSEKTEAQDVTKQYVDMDARLRNLRAEEAQYLTIMKSATKVPDMLDVSEKLSGVRGEIEQQQAEFTTLSKQIETVAITIALRAQAETAVLGFHWRPLYQLKVASHDALEALANYAGTMAAAILYLPVILLWGATLLLAGFLGWRMLRWVARVLFGWKPSMPALQ